MFLLNPPCPHTVNLLSGPDNKPRVVCVRVSRVVVVVVVVAHTISLSQQSGDCALRVPAGLLHPTTLCDRSRNLPAVSSKTCFD